MTRLARIVVAGALLALAVAGPRLRRVLIDDIVTWDAPPGEPAPLPVGDGPGLSPVPRVRVALIDGLAADTAKTLPGWSALCKRGVELTVDVGFPTISLPVEVALWSGLTQQQTGLMFRSDQPLEPPLRGIPSQVPGSVAIAESHGYIVKSLGFSEVHAGDPEWRAQATAAVAGAARLVFVHVLRVDTAGHQRGHDSPEYRATAGEADAIVAGLVAAAPDARWFLLSDHGHRPTGGHGGEEREVRQVAGCVAGPGVPRVHGDLVHVVDVARALADSVGAKLDPASRGRPLSVALASPLTADQAVPPLGLGAGALAILVVALGLAASSWGVRRWWLAPWWFVVACATLYAVRGEPTLSMPMVYAPHGRAMYLTWLPALAFAGAATWVGLGRTTLGRVVVAQLALPYAAAAGAITACGAWHAVLGAHVAPVVPRFTAWMSPLILIAAHGSAAVALAVLGRLVRSVFDRHEPAGPARTAPRAP